MSHLGPMTCVPAALGSRGYDITFTGTPMHRPVTCLIAAAAIACLAVAAPPASAQPQTPPPCDQTASIGTATMAADGTITMRVRSLPPGLDHVIAVAMAKDPAARFASAGALADAAVSALRDPTRYAPLPPVPSGEVNSYPHTWHRQPPKSISRRGQLAHGSPIQSTPRKARASR